MRTVNTQEPDCSDPRWKVASRSKQVYQKEKFKKVVRLTGRTHTEQARTFPSRSIESYGFGSIMVSWMTCIQITRDKYTIKTEVYRDELRKVKTQDTTKKRIKHNKKYSVAYY